MNKSEDWSLINQFIELIRLCNNKLTYFDYRREFKEWGFRVNIFEIEISNNGNLLYYINDFNNNNNLYILNKFLEELRTMIKEIKLMIDIDTL